jgi:general secretion pathway protein L
MAQPNNAATAGFANAPSAGETLGGAWGWWTTRLAECIPAPIATWLRGEQQTAMLEWSADALVLSKGNSAQPIGRATIETASPTKADDFASAVKTIASRVRGPVTLVVGEQRALRKIISLPLAARDTLRQTVGYDLDRLTPFPSGTVLFDAVEKSVDHAGRAVKAEFVAMPRAPIEALLSAAQRAGLQIVRVIPAAQDAASGINLIRAQDSGEKPGLLRSPHLWLGLLTAALSAAVLVYPLWQKRQQVLEAQPIMAQAERDAVDTDKVTKELQQRINQYNFLPAKRHSTALTVQVLDEVTKLLPDDTWVQNFDLKTVRANATGASTAVTSRELQVQGETELAQRLIGLFENSPLFVSPQYKSPLTKLNYPGQNVNGDRFHLAMEVKTASLPSIVPITTQVITNVPTPAAPGAPSSAPGNAKTAPQVSTPAAPAGAAAAPATPAAPAAPAAAPATAIPAAQNGANPKQISPAPATPVPVAPAAPEAKK